MEVDFNESDWCMFVIFCLARGRKGEQMNEWKQKREFKANTDVKQKSPEQKPIKDKRGSRNIWHVSRG